MPSHDFRSHLWRQRNIWRRIKLPHSQISLQTLKELFSESSTFVYSRTSLTRWSMTSWPRTIRAMRSLRSPLTIPGLRTISINSFFPDQKTDYFIFSSFLYGQFRYSPLEASSPQDNTRSIQAQIQTSFSEHHAGTPPPKPKHEAASSTSSPSAGFLKNVSTAS